MSRDKMCRSKRSIFTLHEAQRLGDKLNQRVYKCPYCFCWHLTKVKINMRSTLIAEKKSIESEIRGASREDRIKLRQRLEEIEQAIIKDNASKEGRLPEVIKRDTSFDIFLQILSELRLIRKILEKNHESTHEVLEGDKG